MLHFRKHRHALREHSTLTGHLADHRAPKVTNFETQALLPIVADARNRRAQLYSLVEEAHSYLSARECHIAVAGDLLAGRGDTVPTRSAQLAERAAR
ncbi:hypothetical protein TcBrA4_0123210 [Trypanosoma cruzi]|nr:hypothetical protein TcBrA4_0123210 [Trypanosoma cruzi]